MYSTLLGVRIGNGDSSLVTMCLVLGNFMSWNERRKSVNLQLPNAVVDNPEEIWPFIQVHEVS